MRITNHLEHLESVKKVFIEYPKIHEQKMEELKTVSAERQDLLHALELGKLNAIQMSKIVRDLKKVQIRRRNIKNSLEVLNEIKRFANTFSHKKMKLRDINDLINRVEFIINRERRYKMRVRTDLQSLVGGEADD